jgi:AcrR family transcriptional regulator
MPATGNDNREQRILDAAADLFVRYGYNKTTVSDIAREAGVSKGAIYLHFESKEQLFESLLLRALETYAARWLDLIDADPAGGTIGGMYKNSLYALSSSPFMSAVFRQDGRVLGTYLRKQDNLLQRMNAGESDSPRARFVRQMQAAGAVRDDLDAAVVAHIMNMLAFGLVAMDEIMPREQIPPTDALIEGIALIMDRALTPAAGGNRDAGKTIVRKLVEDGRQQAAELDG